MFSKNAAPNEVAPRRVVYGQFAAPFSIERPDFGQLYAYWSSRRIGQALPLASDFDLLDLPNLLPYMTVMDLVDRDTLIARFQGPTLTGRLGHDMTGRNVLAFHQDPMRGVAIDAYNFSLKQPCGALARYLNFYASGREALSEALYLPLQTSDAGTTRLVSLHILDEIRGFHDSSETATLGADIFSIDWIDLGFGIPDSPRDQERP